jgi:hypothetical protein
LACLATQLNAVKRHRSKKSIKSGATGARIAAKLRGDPRG